MVSGTSWRHGFNFPCNRQSKNARLKKLRFRMYKLEEKMRVTGEKDKNDIEIGSDDDDDDESSDESGF